METILENIISFIEEIWLKLEETRALDFLQPLLANILADPLLLGLALAVTMIIPYTINKIKKAHMEKESRLDALLQELEGGEESGEVDKSGPLFQNQTTKISDSGQPVTETLEKLDEKNLDSEVYGDEFESPGSEKTIITSEVLNQTPQEIFKNRIILDKDFGWERSVDDWDELYDYISKPFQEDKSVTVSSEGEATSKSENESAEPVLEKEESKEVTEFLEAVSELDKEPAEPVAEKGESDMKLKEVDETTTLQPIAERIAPPAIPERIELSLEEIEVESEFESEPELEAETIAIKSSAGPLLKSMLNSSVSAKTDALVSRLKTFQAELETRFHSLEVETETTKENTATAEPTRKKEGDYQPARVSYKSKRKSRSNKEYLRQLESFIFMAKQKNKSKDA